MQKLLNSLKPTHKLNRLIIPHSRLYIEQRKSGYSILLKYKSPVNQKTRFIKIAGFSYGQKITPSDVQNIDTIRARYEGDIASRVDSLDEAKKIREKERQIKNPRQGDYP